MEREIALTQNHSDLLYPHAGHRAPLSSVIDKQSMPTEISAANTRLSGHSMISGLS